MLHIRHEYQDDTERYAYKMIDTKKNVALQWKYEENGELSWFIYSKNINERQPQFTFHFDCNNHMYDIIDRLYCELNKDNDSNEPIFANPNIFFIGVTEDPYQPNAILFQSVPDEKQYNLTFILNDKRSYHRSVKFGPIDGPNAHLFLPFHQAFEQLDAKQQNREPKLLSKTQ